MTHTTKHTPGPWKAMKKAIQPKDGLFYCMVHEDKEDQSVAPAKGLGLTREEAIANAHLIAAAPAMYEALQAMLDGILFTRGASMSEDRWRTLTTIARTALAQAEGTNR